MAHGPAARLPCRPGCRMPEQAGRAWLARWWRDVDGRQRADGRADGDRIGP